MSINLQRIRICLSLAAAAVVMLFASCSQVTPDFNQSDFTVIYDYKDDENLPTARLSLFMASDSDVRRYERISITSLETGYIWDTNEISILESEGVEWAGCTNLVPPENEQLPSGKYKVTYYNADEKECTVNLEIKYDTDFYDVLFSALPEVMKQKRGIERIAIYDREHILIYFGNRTQEFQTARGIWNTFREANVYQVIWYSRDGTVTCIGPEVPVLPEVEY